MRTLARSARDYASLIKLGHTVFGLPFALVSAVLAHRYALDHAREGLTWWTFACILVAFTAARATAMGVNRIVDRDIDAENPRTATREIPAGVLSVRVATLMTGLSSGVFIAASASLSPLAGWLSLPCLLAVVSYSFFKRFSWTCHLVLGLCLALAPGGAWIAVLADFSGATIPLTLMLAVATWVAGFDVIYSLQDSDFDAQRGLFSIPVRFGTVGALWLSGLLHVVTVGCLVALHFHADLNWLHGVGVGLMAALLAYEHAIVRPNDLSRVDRAFFDLNGYASIGYMACATLSALWT